MNSPEASPAVAPRWVDSHCHLDAAEFADPGAIRAAAAQQHVALCVLPAVEVANFGAVQALAHAHGDAYALGIHPLRVPQASEADLATLDDWLTRHHKDPRLVAVGEIGLDCFVPALSTPAMRAKQTLFYRAQLKLARKHGLPVILHVRRSADLLLKQLRALPGPWLGIAHAFNGSDQQADAFLALGLRLGFGGAVSFERALQLRRLAARLPDSALVLETDAPDIPPHWLYTPAAQRAEGVPQGLNQPAELPRIGAVVAALRGVSPETLAALTTANVLAALPRLRALLPC